MSAPHPDPSPLHAAAPTVARWCARLGGPWVDAEDAAQDVLATAATRLSSLRDPEHFDAWLFGITRRVLAAHRRRVWWRRWVAPIAPEQADEGPGPDAQAAARRRARRLQAWLEELPPPQREVLVLCALEERSSAEVARILDIPQGTVKSRQRLAMARLRALAEEDR